MCARAKPGTTEVQAQPVFFGIFQIGRFFDFEGNFISIFVIVEVLTKLQKKKKMQDLTNALTPIILVFEKQKNNPVS